MLDSNRFDEEEYLEANPDVKAAVDVGAFLSGFEHYKQCGRAEGRVWGRLKYQTREEKILSAIDKGVLGLEIGPSHRPIAPKRDGFNVKVLDHLDAEGLRKKYRDHGVDIAAIEDVDYVWSGEPLSELVGGQKFDWIIASHVIEHTPDYISFINECEKILTENGVLSLVVPDKRYCFDHFRELSSLSSIIDTHILKSTIHSPGKVADYFLNVTTKGGVIGWHNEHMGEYALIHALEEAVDAMAEVERGKYIDVHAWCFVPSSFRILIEDLNRLKLIQLRELSFSDTVMHEFFITLGKNTMGSSLTKEELLKRKKYEIVEGYSKDLTLPF